MARPSTTTILLALSLMATQADAQPLGPEMERPGPGGYPYWGVNRNWHPRYGNRNSPNYYNPGFYQPWRGGVRHGYQPYIPYRGCGPERTCRELYPPY